MADVSFNGFRQINFFHEQVVVELIGWGVPRHGLGWRLDLAAGARCSDWADAPRNPRPTGLSQISERGLAGWRICGGGMACNRNPGSIEKRRVARIFDHRGFGSLWLRVPDARPAAGRRRCAGWSLLRISLPLAWLFP